MSTFVELGLGIALGKLLLVLLLFGAMAIFFGIACALDYVGEKYEDYKKTGRKKKNATE